MILFDIAGHSEYYFSQSTILVQNSSAIFINVVDLSKSDEEITHAVHYWLNFIAERLSTRQIIATVCGGLERRAFCQQC